jgi:hypothetical protein
MTFGNHKELMCLYTMSLGQERIFIGHDWLKKHNPVINWINGQVEMLRDPKKSCRYRCQTKHARKQKEDRRKQQEAKEHYIKFECSMQQPACKEVGDKYDFEHQLRRFIIDPYEWDLSAKRSPTKRNRMNCVQNYSEKKNGKKKTRTQTPSLMNNSKAKE